DPKTGLGLLVQALAAPGVAREVVELPPLLRRVEQGAHVRGALGGDPQLLVEPPLQRPLERLARLDVASGQRDGARSQPARGLSLLGEHVAVPDEHERDALEGRHAGAPRSGPAARGRPCATPAPSALPPAVPRPRPRGGPGAWRAGSPR